VTLWQRLSRPLFVLAGLAIVGTVGYVVLLGSSWLDAAYMTLITISTVGFGEVVPGLEQSAVVSR
jgi:voltage-gated potassium channel